MRFRSFRPTVGPIAVDFGIAKLKVMQLAMGTDGRTPTLLCAAARDVPPDLADQPARRLQFQSEMLAETLRRGRFRGRNAVCTVPAVHTFVQHLQVQRADGKPIEQAVAHEVCALTGRDAAHFIIRHEEVCDVIRNGARRAEVICTAMPREAVIAHMKALRACRLDPVGIHAEHAALVAGVRGLARDGGDATTLIIDVGASRTKAAVSRAGRLLVARVLPVGGRDLHQRGRRPTDPGETPSRSFRARMQALAGEDSAVAVIDTSKPASTGTFDPAAVDALADELTQCARYHQALFPDRRIDRVVFAGGEAADADLARRLIKGLAAPAQAADPLRAFPPAANAGVDGIDPAIPAPAFTVALGLCLMPAGA